MPFAQSGLASTVRLPLRAAGRTHIYNQFVIRVPERDSLAARVPRRRELEPRLIIESPFTCSCAFEA